MKEKFALLVELAKYSNSSKWVWYTILPIILFSAYTLTISKELDKIITEKRELEKIELKPSIYPIDCFEKPELTVNSIKFPEYNDDTFGTILTVEIRNSGGVMAKDFIVEIENLTDSSLYKIDYIPHFRFFSSAEFRKRIYVDSIFPGEEKTLTTSIDSIWIYQPNCKFSVIVDEKNSINECNELNNIAWFLSNG